MNTSAKPILVSVAGGIFLYSGIKGMSLSTTIRDLLTGRNPTRDAVNALPVDAPSRTIVGGGRGTGPHNPPTKGAKYATPKQMYQALRQAGFNPSAAVIMTAIGLAESSGNINAHCYNCAGVTEDSRGVWQINVLAHPWAGVSNLYDLNVNAAAAYQVSSGGKSFTPWSTYVNGAYQQFLNKAMGAAK